MARRRQPPGSRARSLLRHRRSGVPAARRKGALAWLFLATGATCALADNLAWPAACRAPLLSRVCM